MTKISGGLIKTATITGNNIAANTISASNIRNDVNIGGPKISSLTYADDDTAANPAGGETITINGSGFLAGATVLLESVAVGTVAVVDANTITFTAPAKATGSYIVYVVNTDGSTAILVPGIQYSGVPSWTTAAGSLGSAYETASIATSVVATGDAPLTYSVVSGTLPTGSTLSSNGQLSGTAPVDGSSTTYTFTVRASDAQNQETDRQFSITINTDVVTWSAPANNATITTYEYVAIPSNTFVSTSAAGYSTTYSANVLPANVSISGSVLSGTPNTVGNTTSLITSTAGTTGRTSTQTLNFVVQQDAVTWSSPANNTTYTWYINAANTLSLSATSAAGFNVSYAANSLPAGLSISGSTLSGTPTVAGNSSSLITATAATTGRTSTLTLNWVLQLGGDAYWKNTTLLISSNNTVSTNTYLSDASLYNNVAVPAGDVKPSRFNPYTTGYYSNYFNGSTDFLSVSDNAAFAFGTGDFTIEYWMRTPTLPALAYYLYGQCDAGATAASRNVYDALGSDGTLTSQVYYNTSSSVSIASSITLTTERWYHVALVRDGTTIRQYIDGIQRGSGSISNGTVNDSSTIFAVGRLGAYTSNPFLGSISNFRVVKGTCLYPSGTSFTPSTTPLTAVSNTVLLTCQANRFIDSSTNNFTVTRNGSTILKPAHPFGTDVSTFGSAYFDGTGDYISMTSNNFVLGTGDFTIEMWVYYDSTADAFASFFTTNPDGTYNGVIMGSDIVGMYTASGGSGNAINPSIPTNTWTHIAMARQGTTVRVFVNGVSAGSFTSAMDINNPTATIGARYIGGSYPWKGYISDVRVVKGTAVYTSNFTPTTTPLTAIAGTKLLTLRSSSNINNNTVVDQSSLANIVIRNGNATSGSFSPFGDNWSNYFDGTGDCLTTSSSAGLGPESGAFTFECWAYPTSNPSNGPGTLIDCRSGIAAEGWVIRIFNDLTVGLYNGPGNAYVYSTGTVAMNQWNHIAVVRSSTGSGGVTFYINGTASGTATVSSNLGSSWTARIGSNYSSGYDFYGYISNLRMVKGTAVYSTSFSPSSTPLLPIANTQLLVCQSNRHVDNSPNNLTVTKNNDVVIHKFSPFSSTALPVYYSRKFSGSSNYLTLSSAGTPMSLSGDFTAEFWVYPTGLVDGNYYHMLSSGYNGQVFKMYWAAAGGSIYHYDGSSYTFASNTSMITNNAWHHIAFVRSGSNTRMYVNGTGYSTVSGIGTVTWSSTFNVAGASSYENFPGIFSNLRIVKGTAVYDIAQSTITVPTSPLTAISNTSLLTFNSNTLEDRSSNRFSLALTGSDVVKPMSPFTPTAPDIAPYSPLSLGGSMYFDGTGDYYSVVVPNTFNSSTTNSLTIEFWSYPTGGNFASLFGFFGFGTTSNGYSLEIDSNRWVLKNAGGSDRNTYVVDAAYVPMPLFNTWAHYAIVFRANSTVDIYINGVRPANMTGGTSVTSSLSNGTFTIGSAYGNQYLHTGYIADFRVTPGAALYGSNFYPGPAPATPTPSSNGVTYSSSLLLNGTTSPAIVDASRTVDFETVGDAKLISESATEGNYYSVYYDGSGDYQTFPNSSAFAFGTGAFTIEFWVNASLLNDKFFLSGRGAVGTMHITTGGYGGTTAGCLRYVGSTTITSGSTVVTDGTWHHCAITRDGAYGITLYVDGVVTGSGTDSTNYTTTSGTWHILANDSGPTPGGPAYLSNLRIVKGSAVYTGAFTPPTSPLTAVSGTQLLTLQSNKNIDNSTNALTITTNGDVAVKSSNPFRKNTGVSMYFDGTGDCLYAANTVALGTSFTIECWYYPTGGSGYRAILSTRALPDETGSTATSAVFLGVNSSNNVYYDSYNTQFIGSGTVTPNAWNHIVCVRNVNTVTVYLNGVSQGTITDGADKTLRSLYIGGQGLSTYPLTGYVSDLRITKGVARYTTAFTPPTAPLDIK